MGKNNKARRAAKSKEKAKARARQRAQGSSRSSQGFERGNEQADEPFLTEAQRVRGIIFLALRDDEHGRGSFPDAVDRLRSMRAAVVDREVGEMFTDQVDAVWAAGWQPVELRREARRACSTVAAARLVEWAMAADHVGRRSTTLDSRWTAQVESLELPHTDGRLGWFAAWSDQEGLDRAGSLRAALGALSAITYLPRLDRILPPPGSPGVDRGGVGSVNAEGSVGTPSDPLFERIRNLLAKAESTTFEAEASALTAKAQELMTRHAIDLAVLHADTAGDDGERPVAIRIPVDAPYADIKALLLQRVAEIGRCRAVSHDRVAMSTVVGFAEDVSATEMLFTSLLVQAQAALVEAAEHAPPGTRTRSQSYRSAFLFAYTDRISDRLEEINHAVVEAVEAEQGSSFLPVLRDRASAVDDFMDERFGGMVTSAVRGGGDAAGWARGQIAADNAQLAFGDLGDERDGDGGGDITEQMRLQR